MRILHVVGHLGNGGDSTAILNILDYIDNNNLDYDFDFLTHKGANMFVVDNLKNRNINITILDRDAVTMKPVKYYKILKDFLKENNYDAIHFHTSFQSFVGLYAAKKARIGIRICHAHTTNVQRKVSRFKKLLYLPICRFLINYLATEKISCSVPAGKFLFGKKAKFKVIYNGLNIKKIKEINDEKTKQIITKYDLKNKTVIGQVGSFNDNKNQIFSLELAKELDSNKYAFFLLGDGPNFSLIKDEIIKNNLKNVIVTGRVGDVNNYMSIFDFLILPSKYGEGLPVTLIEEQIINPNCECITSNIVTEEANLGNVVFMELVKDKWIENIKNKTTKEITDIKKFDINNTAKEWLMLYEQK